MTAPSCANRCGLVADLAQALARATGQPEGAVRLAYGLDDPERRYGRQRGASGAESAGNGADQ